MVGVTWISLAAMILEFQNEDIKERKRLFDHETLLLVEYIFIVISTIELLLRIIADGFVLGHAPMMKDLSDVLHVTIYIGSVVFIIWQPEEIERFSLAYFLMVVRCLRPIRMITCLSPLRKEVWKVNAYYLHTLYQLRANYLLVLIKPFPNFHAFLLTLSPLIFAPLLFSRLYFSRLYFSRTP